MDEVQSTIDYLVPTSRINRRFWAPGKELNTGVYASYPVTIRNARLAGPCTLDAHGFCLGRRAEAMYRQAHPRGPGYRRFMGFSFVARAIGATAGHAPRAVRGRFGR